MLMVSSVSARGERHTLAPTPSARGGRGPHGLARALVGATCIAVLLIKDTLRRLAGFPRGTSFLATLFTFGVLADALSRVAAPALRASRPAPPSLASTALAGAVLREIPGRIGGDRARGVPFAGTIIAVSLAHPILRVLADATAPLRGLPRALAGFLRRYAI